MEGHPEAARSRGADPLIADQYLLRKYTEVRRFSMLVPIRFQA
jgi:hypothetical protein